MKPTSITVRRLREDTYAEIFSISPLPEEISSVVLTIEGVGSMGGVIDEDAGTITFEVSSEIALAEPATYDYDIVVTYGGADQTRTVVQGRWIVLERAVED